MSDIDKEVFNSLPLFLQQEVRTSCFSIVNINTVLVLLDKELLGQLFYAIEGYALGGAFTAKYTGYRHCTIS